MSLPLPVCRGVVLCVPNSGDEYVLYTDASANAVGGCLHVKRDEEGELPSSPEYCGVLK